MGDCSKSDCSGDDGPVFTCNYCSRKFCSDHRLPENHSCAGLAYAERQGKHLEGWHDTLEGEESTARSSTSVNDVTLGDENSDADGERESERQPSDAPTTNPDGGESDSRTPARSSGGDHPSRDYDYDDAPTSTQGHEGSPAKAMDTDSAPKYSSPKKGEFGSPSPDVNPDGSIKRTDDEQRGQDWSSETTSPSLQSVLRDHWMALLVVVYLVFLVVLFQL